MKIKEIKAKSIIVKSSLPEGEFVINPYIGCSHACIYCYARFMKRFTGHSEPWGCFVDAKINAPDLIPENTNKFENKYIVIGSVTDPYLPIENKYELTRKILKKLISLQPHLEIITKSDLIIRDIDLLKQFKNCNVVLSFSSLDDEIRKKIEPGTIPIDRKMEALKKLHKAGIHTTVFISPIFPKITDWKSIIKKTKSFVDEFWFENLNLYPSIKGNVFNFLKDYNLELTSKYEKIYSSNSDYWSEEEKEINAFCKKHNLNCKIYFHHKKKD